MIEIPQDRLAKEVLDAIIESFVLREGTDYGDHEINLTDKIAQVRRQLVKGDIVLVFDETLETCNLLTRKDFEKIVNG